MTYIYILIFYIISIVWCRQTIIHFKKINSYDINTDDLIITLVPFVNIMFALFFTVEFVYKWLIKKLNIKTKKINFNDISRKFFGE